MKPGGESLTRPRLTIWEVTLASPSGGGTPGDFGAKFARLRSADHGAGWVGGESGSEPCSHYRVLGQWPTGNTIDAMETLAILIATGS